MSLLRPLIRSVPTIAQVPHRAVLSVSGSQASDFLNGILACTPSEPKKPFFSAFLQAQGRVLYDVFLYTRTEPDGKRSYLIEHDSRAPPLLPILKRYVLRKKVKVRDLSDEYNVWAAWGSEAEVAWEQVGREWQVARSGAIEPQWNAEAGWPWGEEDEALRDRRAPGMGKRMLVRAGDRPPQASTHDTASGDAYTLHRILHGVPEGIVDIPPPPSSAFPMESNLDVMGGLDFRKGCYVGQELTVRTYHTGVIRKRILPVVLHPPDQAPPELVVPNPSFPSLPSDLNIAETALPMADGTPRPRPRGSGRLLSSTQGVGLALLRYSALGQPQKAERRLLVEVPVEGGVERQWAASYWWPDWWPKQPAE
ncbi:hypothetical protein PLICRDRAFT_33599 [Plicaturopsis crispa FD-325 SS-3]|nr:hypothetical protein PLICRDRAFT_33599 [Plicaturopsis crispa FD-325 SS-3]